MSLLRLTLHPNPTQHDNRIFFMSSGGGMYCTYRTPSAEGKTRLAIVQTQIENDPQLKEGQELLINGQRKRVFYDSCILTHYIEDPTFSLYDLADGWEFTSADVEELVALLGARCRATTRLKIREALVYRRIPKADFFKRVQKNHIPGEGYKWEYVTGQDYSAELQRVRKALLAGV
jgi:hypothetical protein